MLYTLQLFKQYEIVNFLKLINRTLFRELIYTCSIPFNSRVSIVANKRRESSRVLVTRKLKGGIASVSVPNFFQPVRRESTVEIRLFHPTRPFFTFVIFRASRLAARTIRRGCRRFFVGTVPPHCC